MIERHLKIELLWCLSNDSEFISGCAPYFLHRPIFILSPCAQCVCTISYHPCILLLTFTDQPIIVLAIAGSTYVYDQLVFKLTILLSCIEIHDSLNKYDSLLFVIIK